MVVDNDAPDLNRMDLSQDELTFADMLEMPQGLEVLTQDRRSERKNVQLMEERTPSNSHTDR